jgi:hypothetical protein
MGLDLAIAAEVSAGMGTLCRGAAPHDLPRASAASNKIINSFDQAGG